MTTSGPALTSGKTVTNHTSNVGCTSAASSTMNGAAPAAAAPHLAPTRVMQSDEDFNIRFVNLVRMHKCLYDKKVPEYRNRDNQEKAWSLISQETKESVVHCKERWRNLRACLSRYIKQQNSADPQHKPYYLTEHMAFLLPFLKSTRNSFDLNHVSGNLSALFHLPQHQHPQHMHSSVGPIQVVSHSHLHFNDHKLEVKQSLSENDDEETIDAFDPAVTANLHIQRPNNAHTPALSDTASANTLQNFIPDVQISELRTPDTQHHELPPNKRIKSECHASEATTTAQLHIYGGENSDMEFFRSILTDIASLTPQQKRKFKIGVLELIDDVLQRYPLERCPTTAGRQRRNSSRDWRK